MEHSMGLQINASMQQFKCMQMQYIIKNMAGSPIRFNAGSCRHKDRMQSTAIRGYPGSM